MDPMQLAECLPAAVKEMLANQIFENAARDQEQHSRGYREGYEDGHRSGWEVGYGHAHAEMAAAWRKVYETVQRTAKTEPFTVLQERRYPKHTHTEGGRNAA